MKLKDNFLAETDAVDPENSFLKLTQMVDYCLDRAAEEEEKYNWKSIEDNLSITYKNLSPELQDKHQSRYEQTINNIKDLFKLEILVE